MDLGGALRNFDVVILGAGAAGLMCAIEAGQRGRRTLVLDHADKAGKKILISGGGRSNFTNLNVTAENFLSDNPHFVRSALARYTAQDFVALVERHGISYHEKTLGQLFCDRSSRDILELLLRECAAAKVGIELETRIADVRRETGLFVVDTSSGEVKAASVVVATGGLSIPQMGATGFGYDIARRFGLEIVEPRPALVPLTFAPDDRVRWCDLSGVSTEVVARRSATGAGKRERTATFREKLLITHRGISGPAALQISSYWRPGESVTFDLAPDTEAFAPLRKLGSRRDPAAAATIVRGLLPARWAERWLAVNPPQATKDLSNASIAALEQELHTWTVTPAGSEGFTKAEVTAGGVSTKELDPGTLAARKQPGLFFIGEVVDVTGWLGGYNFQWAWSSGYCAGQVV